LSRVKRLFFGLLPPAEVRQQLVALQQQWVRRGTRHHPRDLHMTLVFIGMSERQECLETFASQLRLPPFELVIDTIDYWRRPKVLLAGSSQVPEPLERLVAALNAGADDCEFKPESREYRPHVTLSRRSAPVGKQAVEPIVWPVDSFRLFWSRDGIGTPRYQTLATWKLVDIPVPDADHRQPGSG
jgi:RNA 2',3'-cyclic 3'-phosphodiesterase